MDRLELVHNGEIIRTVESDGGKTIEGSWELTVESSGWLAVRVLGPPQHGAMDSYLFAHTNPVYVVADGAPIRSSSDALFFVNWIDDTIRQLQSLDRWDDPAHKAEVLATFEKARDLYRDQAGTEASNSR